MASNPAFGPDVHTNIRLSFLIVPRAMSIEIGVSLTILCVVSPSRSSVGALECALAPIARRLYLPELSSDKISVAGLPWRTKIFDGLDICSLTSCSSSRVAWSDDCLLVTVNSVTSDSRALVTMSLILIVADE